MPTEPTPSPAPASEPRILVPVQNVTDRLPGLNRLPDDVRPLVVIGLNLLLLIVLFVGLRAIIVRAVQGIVTKITAREESIGQSGRAARFRTLTALMTSVGLWTLGFVFLMTALTVLNFNVAPLLASASVVGLAVGFGAQKIAKDVISGFFLLLEDQYAIGDYVTIGSVTGTVEELAMRTTRIRDDEGKLFILSNGDIGQVCNQSRGPVLGTFEISVAAAADTEQAADVLNTALAEQTESLGLAEAARVQGITAADATKTTFRVAFRTGAGHRPGPATLHLRDAARRALRDAGIALG